MDVAILGHDVDDSVLRRRLKTIRFIQLCESLLSNPGHWSGHGASENDRIDYFARYGTERHQRIDIVRIDLRAPGVSIEAKDIVNIANVTPPVQPNAFTFIRNNRAKKPTDLHGDGEVAAGLGRIVYIDLFLHERLVTADRTADFDDMQLKRKKVARRGGRCASYAGPDESTFPP